MPACRCRWVSASPCAWLPRPLNDRLVVVTRTPVWPHLKWASSAPPFLAALLVDGCALVPMTLGSWLRRHHVGVAGWGSRTGFKDWVSVVRFQRHPVPMFLGAQLSRGQPSEDPALWYLRCRHLNCRFPDHLVPRLPGANASWARRLH